MDVVFAAVRAAVLLTAFGLWAASVVWTARDARDRLPGGAHARLAALLALALPGAGLLLYLCVRPAESALDRRERRAVRRLLERELHPAPRCLLCRTELRPEYRCCPGCGDELGRGCRHCGSTLRLGWEVCPYCETPVTAPAPLHAVA